MLSSSMAAPLLYRCIRSSRNIHSSPRSFSSFTGRILAKSFRPSFRFFSSELPSGDRLEDRLRVHDDSKGDEDLFNEMDINQSRSILPTFELPPSCPSFSSSASPPPHWAPLLAESLSTQSFLPQLIGSDLSIPWINKYYSDFFKNQEVIKVILKMRKEYPEGLVLTKVGGFYESYFDQVKEISRLLGIRATSKPFGGDRHDMAGFPIDTLESHLRTLVLEHQRTVLIVDEYLIPSPTNSKGIAVKKFERKLSRIVTPGTYDHASRNGEDSNFVLAIKAYSSLSEKKGVNMVDLAWSDVSTGEYYSQRFLKVADLRDTIARLAPTELVMDHTLRNSLQKYRNREAEGGSTSHPFWSQINRDLISTTTFLDNFPLTPPTDEEPVTSLLQRYFARNLLASTPLAIPSSSSSISASTPSSITEIAQDSVMRIDASTLLALEIKSKTLSDVSSGNLSASLTQKGSGGKGTLLKVVKRTCSLGGARLLGNVLSSPSTILGNITFRQTMVTIFFKFKELREDLRLNLKEIPDLSKVMQRFLMKKSSEFDLVLVMQSIKITNRVLSRIHMERKNQRHKSKISSSAAPSAIDWTSLDSITGQVDPLNNLLQRLEESLNDQSSSLSNSPTFTSNILEEDSQLDGKEDEDSLVLKSYGDSVVRTTSSQHLQHLVNEVRLIHEQVEDILSKLKNQFGATVKMVSSRDGYYIRSSASAAKKMQSSPIFKGSVFKILKSSATVVYPPWTNIGQNLSNLQEQIFAEQDLIIENLKQDIIKNAPSLQKNAFVIDEIDVAQSFAQVAEELQWVAPVVDDSTTLDIKDGRHPTVEVGLATRQLRTFVSNSLEMKEHNRMKIITGANMGGKSTFLRMIALIVMLAQCGSYVPASYARIGICDSVLSRIGSGDDLYNDMSTFMVEMKETAHILNSATERSLVILDEVGRGTDNDGGIAIAVASINHILNINKSRALFATHHHEVADLLSATPGVEFLCTRVVLSEEGLAGQGYSFDYRLVPGVNKKSHAIAVASMASMPQSVLLEASALLVSKQNEKSKV